MADDSAIGKPFPVGLDARDGFVSALIACGLCDFALGVALWLALFEDVKLLDFLCGAVEILSGNGLSVSG